MERLYTISQGGKSLGSRNFKDTKRFVLKCCLPSIRPAVVRAKRLSSLGKALGDWADIKLSAVKG